MGSAGVDLFQGVSAHALLYITQSLRKKGLQPLEIPLVFVISL
jgi:hypothetical protein